jgi:hypothetical protein
MSAAIPAGSADRELVAVEHPCHAVNMDRAIETLGGSHDIARAFFEKAPLHCSLRAADPLSHPLHGERSQVPGLLLRIVRRRDGSEPARVEVVGQVTQTVRFAGLADFQHVSHPRLISGLMRPWERQPQEHRTNDPPQPGLGTTTSDDQHSTLAPFALSIPPASFCISDLPIEFITRRPGASTKRDVAQVRVQALAPPPKRRRRTGIGRSMQFGTAIALEGGIVPSGPPEDVKQTIQPDDPLYKAMWEHFQKRPIWLRGPLKRAIGTGLVKSDAHIRFNLPQLAYYFLAGP